MTEDDLPPLRLRRPAFDLRKQILTLPGVYEAWMRGTRNFRIGKKLFVCFAVTPTHVSLEFKPPKEDALQARKRHAFVKPMKFANMGKHGWVEIRFPRKAQMKPIFELVKRSRMLYPA